MVDFGKGIKLDEDWDLVIGNSGDIAREVGLDELEKDLAFRTAENLVDVVGEPQTKRARTKAEIRVRDAVNADPRIDTVRNVTVNEIDDGFEVVVGVVASDETAELVFEV